MIYETLREDEYQGIKLDVIEKLEGKSTKSYLDGEGVLTIGIGWNISVQSNLRLFLISADGLNIDEARTGFEELIIDIMSISQATYQPGGLVDDITTEESTIQDQLNQIIRDYLDDDDAEFAFDSESNMERFLETNGDKYESMLETHLTNNGISVPESYERLALWSLVFNGGTGLIGENLTSALQNDDRAAAWFEIRYASNGDAEAGIQKRRYYESQLFGLFDSRGGSATEVEANRIIQFLFEEEAKYPDNGSRNIDTVLAKENEYWEYAKSLGVNAVHDYDLSGYESELGYGEVFRPISEQLINYFAGEDINNHASDISVDLSSYDGEVVLGLETRFSGGEGSTLQPLYRKGLNFSPKPGDPLVTNSGYSIPGISDVLIGVDEGQSYTIQGLYGDDLLVGNESGDVIYGDYKDERTVDNPDLVGGNDVLIGKGGDDTLYGHDGNDILLGGDDADTLIGGEGFDYLYGGDGGDSYDFSQGHGVDFIKDGSEGNSIVLDGITLSEFESLSAANGIYSNGQDGLRLLKVEDGFILVQRDATGEIGAIAVEGDASNFGITLIEYDEDAHEMPPVDPGSFEVGDADLNASQSQMAFAMASSLQDDEDWLNFDYENRGADPDQSWINSTPIFMDASLINADHPGFPNNPQSTSWVFEGGDANDTLLSDPTHFNDRLYGMGGDDTIVMDAAGWGLGGGGEGNDYLEDRNNSHLFGDSINPQDINDDGSGEDVLISFSSTGTRMDGGGGDDVLRAEGDGNHHLSGGSGSDTISSGNGNDEILGDGNVHVDVEGSSFQFTGRIQDVLDPSRSYDDVIDAGHGNNKVIAGSGDDTVTTGDGDDLIHGDVVTVANYTGGWSLSEEVPLELHGDDVIYAGAGADEVVGGGGNDTIFGGDGDDLLFGDADSTLPQAEGDDFIDGGAGNDTIQAGKGDDVLLGGAGEDTLLGLEGADYLSGGAGKDALNGGEGNDKLVGGAGDDELLGYAGSDQLNGGAGDDFVQDYWNAESGDQNSLLGGAGDDVLLSGIGMDTLDGGAGSDKLFSGSGDDTLYGGSGRLDYLLGESGDDTLIGGAGTDFMFGGAGDDTYVFGRGDGQDGIMDASGNNQIVFNGVSSESADIYAAGSGLMVRYGAGDAVSLSGSALISSSISFDGTEYDSSGVWGLFLYQQRSLGLNLAGMIKAGGMFSYSSSMGLMTASTNTSPSISSSSNLTAWYGGQLVAIDSATAGIDAQDPSTWLKKGATSLTGALIFYSNANGDVMAGVPVGDGTYQAPAGAITEHTLLPDGTLLSREPNFASEEDLVATPGEDVELPSGVEGDTSGIDASDEVIEGTSGDDAFDGGEGMDLIRGDGGADTLDGGSGNDVLFGGMGDDDLLGRAGDDFLYGDAGADLLQGGDGNDFLEGGSGDDELRGGSGNDLLIGGAGNDTLKGGGGSDQYFFSLGDGQDVVDNSGDTGFSTIAFAEDISPYDVTVSRAGDDLLLMVGSGGDTLTVTGYFANEGATARAVDEVQFNGGRTVWTIDDVKAQALVGDSNDNILQGYSDSDDHLKGMRGDDLLFGESGDDSLDGGSGNDTLEGGAGNDTYLIDLNEGHDQIVELTGENNKLQFGSDVQVEDVKAIREGDDLHLSLGGGTSSVTVASYFAAARETISSILFEDGSSWDLAQVKQLVLTGTDDADTINGYDSDDTLTGEAGEDLLTGNGGNDTYRFSSGDGRDVIVTGETDTASTETIRFDESVSDGDVSVLRNGDDVILGYGNGDSVTVQDFFLEEATTASAVDRVEFSSGTVWTTDDLKAKVLLGDGEANTIEAYSSDDLLEGNDGNDILVGGSGDDTYRFSEGDGADLIDDQAGSQDRIEFTDVNAADVLLRRDAEDLLITNTASGDTIRVEEQFSTLAGEVSPSAIDSIIFADATSWSYEQIKQQALAGTENIDEIYGHADADTIYAGGEADTVFGAAGGDTIFGEGGGDTLYGEDGDDEIRGGDGNDHLDGGTGHSTLYGDAGDDTLLGAGLLYGGDGNDNLNAQGASTLTGGAGTDTLTGSSVSDTYRFSAGDGTDQINDLGGDQDQIEFVDVNPGQVLLRRDGNDLMITNPSSGDAIRVENQFSTLAGAVRSSGVDRILFADATVWDYEQIKQEALAGTAAADEIYGHADADSIAAGAGDDIVYGRAGNDTISGGLGQDSLYGESGDDEIHGNDGVDKIYGGAGNDQLYGDEGDDVIEDYTGENVIHGGSGDDELSGSGSLYGDEGEDTLTGSGLLDGGADNDTITGEGADTLIGGSGDDVITAYSAPFTQNSNILEGGTGDDSLFGSFGNDEYRFNLGDGHDTLTERRVGEDYSNVDPSSDTLVFGSGISQADLQFERHGSDLLIAHSNGTDSVLVNDWYKGVSDHFKLNNLQFSDGSSLALSDIEGLAVTHGTTGEDTLQGYRNLNDTIRAGGGDDQVWGRNGDDTLYGESGDDYLDGDAGDDLLEGGSGADTLVGRSGSDTLIGGIGDDSYLYTPGSGSDLIINADGGYDGLFFLDGIDRERLSFERNGDDLVVVVDEDAAQSVRVQNHFLGGDHAIDYVQPDGGFLLDTDEINQIVAAGGSDYDAVIEGTANGEQLMGTSGNDLIQGLAGDDTLFGMGGDDEIEGGAGSDYLSGGNGSGSGSGNDILVGGEGNDVLHGEDGDDLLTGGLGNDQYFYTPGGGVDTVNNEGGGFDGVFFLNGVTRNRLSFHQEGEDLVILLDSDLTQQVRVSNHFLGGDNAISYVQPDDGGASIMAGSIPGLLEALPDAGDSGEDGGDSPGDDGEPPLPGLGGEDVLNGTTGADILVGGEGDDTLSGNVGNDILVGGAGDDLYLYAGGEDSIDSRGGGADTLRFTGSTTFSEVASYLSKSGDDLILKVNGGPDQVTLTDFFLGGENLVETIEFETGGLLTADQVFSAFGLSEPAPVPGFDDTLEGSTGDDVELLGSSGADLVRGGNGDDVLKGVGGDDRLEGGNGADTLEGGSGVDLLMGGRGDDLYVFRPGDGQDVIDNTGGGTDELHFDGISFNEVASGLMKSGDDLVLNVSDSGDSVTLKNWFSGGDAVVDTLTFASGGSISAGQIFGAFGLSNADPAGSPDYHNLPDERGYANLVAANQATHNIFGSSDADFIDAGAGDDVLDGGFGNDYLIGGDGSDTYQINTDAGQDVINNQSTNPASDADVLRFLGGFDESNLWFSQGGDDLVVDVIGSEEQVTIQDWYLDSGQKMDEIRTDDAILQADMVDNLVNAMAAFGAPPAGNISLPQDVRDSIDPVIAANWQTA